MSQVLFKIVELTSLIYSKESFWKVTEMMLHPPAKGENIAKLSSKQPFKLPPSYLQFLTITDGCINFWPCFTLLGTEGEPDKMITFAIKDALDHQSKFACDSKGKLTVESVTDFEAPKLGRYRFFLPWHIVFGTSQGGEFLMFNEKHVLNNGEYEVIHYTYDGGAYARFESFPAFLEKTVEELQERIKDKKYAKKKK